MVMEDFITLIPLAPLVSFLFIGIAEKSLTKGWVSVIGCGSILVSFALSIVLYINLLQSPSGSSFTLNAFEWIAAGDFAVSMSFLVDPLSCLMMLVITGVGFLIHVYSAGYMWEDDGFRRFFMYLNLFIFFMLLLVMGSNYLVMFVGWEGVGLCSYLLIGFWFKNQDYNDAAKKAFIMNRIGDLGLILGVILIFMNFGSLDYQTVFAKAEGFEMGSAIITTITILLFVGAIGKSAQIPLYTWLPDAMAGPTPVSALIHAATMVTAGVYMIARNNILYTLAPFTLEIVLIIGLVTALFAATIAIAQNDIKKVLAYSTVSQLGLMFVAMGVGAYATGMFHMMTHAFFKALLFLAAGSVIHGLSGEQDIRNMGGLRKYLPITFGTFLIGTIAIAGIPPFAGFFSKDEILANTFAHNQIAWGIAVLASLLTSFYMFRLFFLTFSGSTRATPDVVSHIHESPKSMTVPLMILAFFSAVGGFFGIPEVFGGPHALSTFLAPVFEKSKQLVEHTHLSHETELTLMGVIVALTIVMIVAAYIVYVSKKSVPAADREITGVHNLVYKKYFIDELYDVAIVKPLNWFSKMMDTLVEKLFIDRVVNGTGRAVMWGSKTLRLAQTGNTGLYILIMVVSVIILFAVKTFM
jgi:NADH-quinone oxidoreductase subunit L